MTKRSGICVISLSILMKTWLGKSCWKGALFTLKVPSIYQVLALDSSSNMWSEAKIRFYCPSMVRTSLRKLSGMWYFSNTKSKFCGCFRLFMLSIASPNQVFVSGQFFCSLWGFTLFWRTTCHLWQVSHIIPCCLCLTAVLQLIHKSVLLVWVKQADFVMVWEWNWPSWL